MYIIPDRSVNIDTMALCGRLNGINKTETGQSVDSVKLGRFQWITGKRNRRTPRTQESRMPGRALECPWGTHCSIVLQFLTWQDDVRRDNGVRGENEEAGTKQGKEVKGTESGSENEDYGEEIEWNTIPKTDDKGNRRDSREKTLCLDFHDKER
ncbi:hypothetical protein NDU88_007601 [Pleurodeles waltl]|uniref:Uncharacterized protein n=1 Tax=Pleurodeles waltl TaxID=8319 RepID=A0AAV7VUX1_PLEWA|nr:hypothetical protein NDU88_007601 [Pleurodeles waltl]